MVNQQQAKWVVPNPQIPRSFGLMNIIFGAIMLLVGAGYLAMYVISPTFTKQMQVEIKKQQADQKAEHETKLAELKRKEETAKTEEEKDAVRTERDTLEQNAPPDLTDMQDLMGWNIFSDVRLSIYYSSEVGSGLLLNLLAIISGAGLMALAEWARRLAIGVAWLKIVRWVAMVVVTMVLILPITAERTNKAFAAIETQAKAKSGGRQVVFPMSQMGRFTAIAGAVTTVFAAVIASVYPALSIWFLTRPPARAACLPLAPSELTPKPKEPGESW